MSQPSREEVLVVGTTFDKTRGKGCGQNFIYTPAELEAFALHWYAKGRKDGIEEALTTADATRLRLSDFYSTAISTGTS